MSDTLTAVRDFIKDQANVAATDDLFSDTVDLFDYGYLDSFGIVGLIETIDQRFAIDLSNIDFYEDGHRTIAGIAALIDAQTAGRG